ncbi:SdiA-regulated [Chitinophaga sp. CF118]|uniref:SdiA-regulated domain-containing protein n=1 Tax=Chitinophaga sp. CF118 TaxID=1884367 RepID=UPI0008E328AA|nr:SdiA-regulated domain-containing protein [Chitinophaga sp. CF118]SFE36123.1 SdiA-regulated [Chitinophaga sp. CF118]
MRIRYFVIFLLLLSCNQFKNRQDKNFTSPKGYDFRESSRFYVRQSMQEISGIVLAPDEQHILAINDEQGRVFSLDITANKPYTSWKFDKSGDYEDIATNGKDWMVLKSNGHLYEVTGLYSDSTDAISYKFTGGGKQEFETLYFDSARNSMVMICKNCEVDKGSGKTTAYGFNMGSMEFDEKPVYQINIEDIAKLTDTKIAQFKPSAAAIHPIEKRLYIVAAVNRMLVITDLNGKVLEAHNLKHSIFRQPEGITFAPNGDMYISNEAADEAQANILKFKYHH